MDNFKEKINKIMYHFTYGGTIGSSFLVWVLLFFFKECGSFSHRALHWLTMLKCFCLYDSTPLEYFHHAVQFYIISSNPINSMEVCPDNVKTMLYMGYSLLTTPMFQNMKIYFKPNDKIKLILDGCTFFSFLYVRGKFNYYYLLGDGYEHLSYFVYNHTYKEYVNITYYLLHLSLYLICFMNFFWGYKILNKLWTRMQCFKHKLV